MISSGCSWSLICITIPTIITATGRSKSKKDLTPGWPRTPSGSRASAVTTVVELSTASSARPCESTIGSLST